jgi:hypothetical protein
MDRIGSLNMRIHTSWTPSVRGSSFTAGCQGWKDWFTSKDSFHITEHYYWKIDFLWGFCIYLTLLSLSADPYVKTFILYPFLPLQYFTAHYAGFRYCISSINSCIYSGFLSLFKAAFVAVEQILFSTVRYVPKHRFLAIYLFMITWLSSNIFLCSNMAL